ncbi:exported hypothetical protein [Candidatus Nitrospira nitrificans]|uniref:Uncharacterized protein n=1 Tax=Candidatus Nitrospira nitrificans TaxID=1742973 RepID=A0A0S4LPF3_9BACT|nr:exported hypothetical protein [Candidatus Nitrospira nitrificans]
MVRIIRKGVRKDSDSNSFQLIEKLRGALLVASVAVTLSGCVSSGNASVTDETLTSQIRANVSTKEDVRQLLG